MILETLILFGYVCMVYFSVQHSIRVPTRVERKIFAHTNVERRIENT
jgi:hypothetical protein